MDEDNKRITSEWEENYKQTRLKEIQEHIVEGTLDMALYEASHTKEMRLAQQLIKKGARIDWRGEVYNPFIAAVKNIESALKPASLTETWKKEGENNKGGVKERGQAFFNNLLDLDR